MYAIKTMSDLAFQEVPTIQALIKSIGDINTRINEHYNEFREFKVEINMKLFQMDQSIQHLDQSIKNLDKMLTISIGLALINFMAIIVIILIILIK